MGNNEITKDKNIDIPQELLEDLRTIVANTSPEQRAIIIKEWKDRLE